LPQALVYQAQTSSSAALGKSGTPRGGKAPSEIPPAKLEIRRVLDGTAGLSVGSQRSPDRPDALASARHYHTTHTSWNAASGSVRDDLEALLKYLEFLTTHQPPTIDEIIELLEKLVHDDPTWNEFSAPGSRLRARELRKLGLNGEAQELKDVPERAVYEKVLKYLKEQKKVAGIFGPDVVGTDAALWLCMQIG